MNPPIQIRPMEPSDLDAVVQILTCWNMAPRPVTADVPVSEREAIIVANTFVALDSARVVGVCSFQRRSADLAETASLAVDPAYKGRGIGEMLQVRRLEEMRRRGFKKVRTETDRSETIQWYKRKFGYVEAGTSPKKHDFSLPDVDHWTVLTLDL